MCCVLINYTYKLLKFLHTFVQLHAFFFTIHVCVCACVVYGCGVCVIVSSNLKFLHTFFQLECISFNHVYMYVCVVCVCVCVNEL